MLSVSRRSQPGCLKESNIRLTQITQYARQLASQPTLIDRHALAQLHDVGLTDSDIIILSQIIGYVGYQARVVAGISALAGYPTVMLPGFPAWKMPPQPITRCHAQLARLATVSCGKRRSTR